MTKYGHSSLYNYNCMAMCPILCYESYIPSNNVIRNDGTVHIVHSVKVNSR